MSSINNNFSFIVADLDILLKSKTEDLHSKNCWRIISNAQCSLKSFTKPQQKVILDKLEEFDVRMENELDTDVLNVEVNENGKLGKNKGIMLMKRLQKEASEGTSLFSLFFRKIFKYERLS